MMLATPRAAARFVHISLVAAVLALSSAACAKSPAADQPAADTAATPQASATSGAPGLVGAHDATGAAAPAMGASPHGAPLAGPVTVTPNPPPPGGLSIADTWAKRASLAGKSVTVRGTVVKVNNAIMGTNWFHLRDGSGKDEDGTNDLTVTSDAVVKAGDVVTVTGVIAVDKDLGAGYAYQVILEKGVVK